MVQLTFWDRVISFPWTKHLLWLSHWPFSSPVGLWGNSLVPACTVCHVATFKTHKMTEKTKPYSPPMMKNPEVLWDCSEKVGGALRPPSVIQGSCWEVVQHCHQEPVALQQKVGQFIKSVFLGGTVVLTNARQRKSTTLGPAICLSSSLVSTLDCKTKEIIIIAVMPISLFQ